MFRNRFTSRLFVFLLLGAWSAARAGDAQDFSITNRSMIPFPGNDSLVFVGGNTQCIRDRDLSSPDRCVSFRACVERGEKRYRGALAQATTSTREKFRAAEALGHLLIAHGDRMEEALAAFEQMARFSESLGAEERWLAKAQLAIAYLRSSELQNCVMNHNEDSCLYPLSLKAQHKRKADLEKSIRLFEAALTMKASDHLRWLLNLAYMALGTHPEGVPKQWRMAVEETKGEAFPRFYDIAGTLGLQKTRTGGGGNVLFEDMNGDGFLDLVIAPRLPCEAMRYYEQDGTGRLVDRSKASGLARQLGVTGLVQVDFDNDGDLDLYLGRGAWDPKEFRPYVYNTLMENLGRGKFRDVTKKRGLLGKPNTNIAAVWLDFNKDGWVDLFVCNEQRESDFFENKKGEFVNVIEKIGITNAGICKGVAAGDVNNDGWPDLFLANYGSANQLYLNDAGKRFEKSPQPLIEKLPTLAFSAGFFDYDSDGNLDLFVAGYPRDMEDFAAARLGKPHIGEPSRVFRNMGGGKFEDVTEKLGLTVVTPVMGSNLNDLDGDGRPDIILGTGSVSYGDLVPSLVFANREGKRFADVTVASGMSTLQKGHGVAVGDADNDGDIDVLQNIGGAFPGDNFFPGFYENPGFGNRFVGLQLIGRKSNRSAIGAKITVDFVENGKARRTYSVIGQRSSFGNVPFAPLIGLGKAERIQSVTIEWPNAERLVQDLGALDLDTRYAVVEGEAPTKKIYRKVVWKKNEHRHHLH